MSLDRMPLFVWAQLVTAVMVVFAMPAVQLATTLLSFDRLAYVNTHFFNTAEGGDTLLWQHLFWYFGHPEVYIVFLPATGFISEILPAFTRRQSFGYPISVAALVATGFIAFGVWAHHMFATPLPEVSRVVFTGTSLLIVIPGGAQIFCWVASLFGARLQMRTPMLWVLGFLATFVIGGMTGVMLASSSLDLQLHDTYFVVAHLHYVLIGGGVFPLFGAIQYWFPKWTGRMLDERLGKWHFGLMFTGFHLAFFPMHVLGLEGMPRRVYTYLPETGWGRLNLLATVGAILIAASVVVFVVNVVRSLRRGAEAGDDPWRAPGLDPGAPRDSSGRRPRPRNRSASATCLSSTAAIRGGPCRPGRPSSPGSARASAKS
jgi:heme/copper-type cytochrome/quinol oxidase subunit 1